jgi:V8-like Glu-specific endopeptidase
MSHPFHPRTPQATGPVRSPWRSLLVSLLKLGVAGALAAPLATVACSAGSNSASADPPDPEVVSEGPGSPPVSVDEAIVHGAADRNRHPSVVALLAQDANGTSLCTGALVAPDLVLTARHCVSILKSESVACPSTTAQIRGDRAPESIQVLAGDDARTATPIARGAEILAAHSNVLCGNDYALLRLDRPVHTLAPMKVASRAPTAGSTITAVGYGLTGSTGTAGAKRFRSGVAILQVDAAEFTVGEATCSGDSGGPAIDESTGSIVGVVSRGPQPCDGAGAGNIYTRTDRLAATISAHLKASGVDVPSEPSTPSAPSSPSPPTDAGASGDGDLGDMGDPCVGGASCATGLCVRAGASGYCSRKCGTGQQRCPAGYHCAKTADAGGVGVCGKV